MNSQNSVLSYAETILLQKTLKYWYYWSTRHSKDTLTTQPKILPHIYYHFHYLWKLIKEDESSLFANIDRFSTNYIQCNFAGFDGERKSASSFCNLRKVIHRTLYKDTQIFWAINKINNDRGSGFMGWMKRCKQTDCAPSLP